MMGEVSPFRLRLGRKSCREKYFQAWRKAILTHVLRNNSVFTKRILNTLETMTVNHVELSGLHGDVRYTFSDP